MQTVAVYQLSHVNVSCKWKTFNAYMLWLQEKTTFLSILLKFVALPQVPEYPMKKCSFTTLHMTLHLLTCAQILLNLCHCTV